MALAQLSRVIRPEGRFALCDLGKPDGPIREVIVAMYLRVMPTFIGLATTGRAGMKYGSLFDTYQLVLHNSELASALSKYIGPTTLHETQMGGSIVAKSLKRP